MRALLIGLAVLLAGCAPGGGATPQPVGPGEAPAAEPLTGELVVFAAASLTDALEAVAAALEAAHPDLDVLLNLAGSQQLAGQIVEGAPADVVVTASSGPMDRIAEAGLLDGEPEVVATTALAIVVEAGNPLGVTGLADLARDDLLLVLAAPEVPAGQYAAEALAAAGVTVAPASLEVDVRAVLGKVALGEADAGIVYRSDLASAGPTVEGVAIPDAENVVARYPAAALAAAPNPAAAAAFLAVLRSDEGLAALVDAGFTAP
jgi:molybdate transport system substrate-binding protein